MLDFRKSLFLRIAASSQSAVNDVIPKFGNKPARRVKIFPPKEGMNQNYESLIAMAPAVTPRIAR
jgi:hypothetical protein